MPDNEWLRLYTGKKNHWEMIEWCEQEFGPRWSAISHKEGTWCCFWTGFRSPIRGGEDKSARYEWSFHNEDDAMLFVLRWI